MGGITQDLNDLHEYAQKSKFAERMKNWVP